MKRLSASLGWSEVQGWKLRFNKKKDILLNELIVCFRPRHLRNEVWNVPHTRLNSCMITFLHKYSSENICSCVAASYSVTSPQIRINLWRSAARTRFTLTLKLRWCKVGAVTWWMMMNISSGCYEHKVHQLLDINKTFIWCISHWCCDLSGSHLKWCSVCVERLPNAPCLLSLCQPRCCLGSTVQPFAAFWFTVEPQDTLAVRGNMAMLNCSVHSDAATPVHIEWKKDGTFLSLVSDDRRHILPDGTLVFSHVVHAKHNKPDEGTYQCVATIENLGSISSRTARLTVAGRCFRLLLCPKKYWNKTYSKYNIYCKYPLLVYLQNRL